MAELLVKGQCRSSLRRAIDAMLNFTFPVWGIAFPISAFFLIMGAIGYLQSSSFDKVGEQLAYLALCLFLSITCLLLKRAVSFDAITVDRQGITLPRLMGLRVNLSRFIAWQNIARISATSSQTDAAHTRLVITKKRGLPLRIPLSQLQSDFVEQFMLAAQIWAPALCDPSLAGLQTVLRIGAHESSAASYTQLWEEELGRRFCPTSFVPLETGQVLRNSSLKVVNQLGSGGLSALYLCQLEGKQLVVLKEAFIPEGSAENVREKAKEMFEREARLLMKIEHPGIVHVLDYFTELERNYLLLDYINGVDLRQLVTQNGPQRESDVLEWAIQVAGSLKYLHEREQPIIHRDLTPDNIVLRNDGQAIIVDFGAANEFIGTATGTFVGKHSFIAPEQLRGKANIRSDIYALGCTLFFLLTGAEPEALSPSNPRELAPATSDELCELIESCTQLEASDRYQSVAQMLPVLRRLAAQSMVS
jgi:tRNA A-37 threonylcarbamoyl transferase component Bud32